MVFSSIDFIFKFLPVFLLLYGVCPSKWKNLCLFAGSLLFYFYGVMDKPAYFLLFLFSIGVNYALGIRIWRKREQSKNWLIAGILYNFLWLFLFKYSGFLAGNLNGLLSRLGIPVAFPLYEPTLPVGISFYTFQAISYLADVYRKTAEYEPSFVNFAMYISMFPQLIAGPIVTYSSIKKEISRRSHSMRAVEEGLKTFTIGLGLKVLLANRLGGLWNEAGTVGYESISTPFAWLAITAFSLQIYFDFYGYSLMAKGLGRIMGFTIPENFHDPYLSLSMTEFWRRWHMTLGSWFRDYVYIPLGGSRKGKLMTFRNMLAVWALTGFWHGASWNFILWGLLMFALISVEKLGLIRILDRVPALGHLYMAFAISVSWVLFAVTDLSQMAVYFTRLFPFLPQPEGMAYFAGDYLKYGRLYGLSLAAGLVFATGLPMKLYRRFKNSPAAAVVLLAVFWGCVYCMKMGMDDPFLYFRF